MSIWTKYEYKLVEFGGVDNCAKCDQFTHIWDMERNDGHIVGLCEVCRDLVTRNEPIRLSCEYGHRYMKEEASSLGCPECLSSFLEKGGSLD